LRNAFRQTALLA